MAGEGVGKVITSSKKVARDGTKRGLNRKGTKNKATLLLEQMQATVREKYGLVGFDPVVMLAVIGVEASQDRVKVDYKGDVVYEVDDQGAPVLHPITGDPLPVIVPADKALAVSALAKAAPYVRSTLKQIEVADADAGSVSADVVGAKEKMARMLGISLEVEEDEDDD